VIFEVLHHLTDTKLLH